MDRENSRGLTEEHLMVIMSMIKKKVMVSSLGQTEELTKECGKMESSMGKVNTREVIMK